MLENMRARQAQKAIKIVGQIFYWVHWEVAGFFSCIWAKWKMISKTLVSNNQIFGCIVKAYFDILNFISASIDERALQLYELSLALLSHANITLVINDSKLPLVISLYLTLLYFKKRLAHPLNFSNNFWRVHQPPKPNEYCWVQVESCAQKFFKMTVKLVSNFVKQPLIPKHAP